MPTNLFCNPNTSRKSFKLTLLFLLSPLFFYAQSLTGLWVGTLGNDSSTVRKDQSFEMALTEYRGKVYGYSRSEFIVDDVLYFIVKRVKGTIVPGTPSGEGDVCEVIDDDIISYNFTGKLDKKVKVTSTFRRDKNDSAWHLDGKWKTNVTKKYYSVTGKIDLEQEIDLTASKIFPHLEELKLAEEVVFYKERKEGAPIVKIAKPEKAAPEYIVKTEKLSAEKDVVTTITQRAEPNTIPVKTTFSTAKGTAPPTTNEIVTNNTKDISKPETVATPVVEKKQPVAQPIAKVTHRQDIPVTKPQQSTTVKQPDVIASKTETKKIPVTTKKSEPVKTDAVVKISPVVEKKEPVATPVIPEIKKPEVDITVKAASIAGRKSEFSQVVNFKSDSLQISLYDNGEIDGDTVSVFMNGEVLLSQQGLKSSAIRKTIYLTGKDDEFTLVMFAESLGKYPPNTGLLVIRDGNDIYNLRFSSDFQKNAGIVFKRKK
jgi:hypothetical protein